MTLARASPGGPCMWTVVYIAPNQPMAEKIQRQLHAQGLMVKVREGGSSSRDPAKKRRVHFEVLVPESEAEDAHELVAETLRSF